jgi:hypothetical protein
LWAFNNNSDPKTKAITLNLLHDLYGDNSSVRALTEAALGQCDENAIKAAMALSYSPNPTFLTQCATKLITEKHWKDAAILVVRFQLPNTTVLPWLTHALNSSIPDEFLAAANIVLGKNIGDEDIV